MRFDVATAGLGKTGLVSSAGVFMSLARSLVVLFFAMLLVACDSNPPELMAATKVFETEQETKLHIVEMRTNHMHLLTHKRDETMYQGIRTPKHSLNACIDCHVPMPTKARIVKHTDPDHFCVTCHIEVAVKLDCFQCHADRPALRTAEVAK